jgi:catalase
MPLPADPKTVETSNGIVSVLHEIFGPHPGFRPVHAKGVLLTGHFKPTAAAASLSKAPHFNNPTTPVIARFSSSTGIPQLPDTDPNGKPRGFALRFQLAETPRHVHTDIVSHSTPFFPVRTGQEFLDFFTAVRDNKVPDFLSTHPKAVVFVQAPKPFPVSLAREAYFSVNAFKLIDKDGKEIFIRYRFVPEKGVEHLGEDDLKSKPANYLYDEVPQAVPIVFKLVAQIAGPGDVTDDSTIHWPEEREVVQLGTVTLDKVADNNPEEQRKIIFDPVPRVEGVEASDDPLIDVRAGVYLISGRERRAAHPAPA